jgi:drug/metabolite transporter (DMT)-like permease/heme-degrading monooxygenase HmoA
MRINPTFSSFRVRLILAFAAVYLIWGSTYLAIRFAIETIPPFLMGAARFGVAGLILYAWARWRGEAAPRKSDLKAAVIIGLLMVVFGNGLVIWSEQFVPSGLAAVFVSTGPLWLVLIDWWVTGRRALPGHTVAGLVTGFAGVTLLTLLGSGLSIEAPSSMLVVSAGIITLAAFSWAAGSIYARRLELKVSLTMLLGLQMMAGSGMLLLAGTLTGEWSRFDPLGISGVSLASLVYLVVMGTLVGYSSYLWLMRVSEPAKVATHGYVNPVVAVFLGWLLAAEPITPGMLFATATILLGVALINGRTILIGRRLWSRFTTPRLTNNPELAMIARTWQGVVPSDKADAYYDYLMETGVAACESTEGNKGVYLLRRDEGVNTRFLFMSMWDSMDAIKQFAGDDPEVARYFPEDEDYLLEKTPNVEHFEVLDTAPPVPRTDDGPRPKLDLNETSV